MARDVNETLRLVCSLVDEVRSTCLWYLREDYYPETVEQALWVLDAIERRGNLAVYREAGKLRAWLSHPSNAPSAAS